MTLKTRKTKQLGRTVKSQLRKTTEANKQLMAWPEKHGGVAVQL